LYDFYLSLTAVFEKLPITGDSPLVLTLVQTKQRRINIYYIKETIQKQSTNNTRNSKYKYIHYQNTDTIVKTSPHTLTHTLQNKLKQPEYKIHTK